MLELENSQNEQKNSEAEIKIHELEDELKKHTIHEHELEEALKTFESNRDILKDGKKEAPKNRMPKKVKSTSVKSFLKDAALMKMWDEIDVDGDNFVDQEEP
eukprot:UN15903